MSLCTGPVPMAAPPLDLPCLSTKAADLLHISVYTWQAQLD